MIFQQIHQFLVAFYRKILPFAVAQNALYLGVVLVAGQQKHLSLLPGLRRQLVNLFHKGAGGVHIGQAQRLDFLLHRLGHPVGADHQGVARGGLLGAAYGHHAPGGQVPCHLGVVDDRPQGGGLFALLQQLVHRAHRPVHPKAEPGGLGHLNSHGAPPGQGLPWPAPAGRAGPALCRTPPAAGRCGP